MEISNYIAAIDLGSSKIVGIIGTKSEDNILSVHAVDREPADACIKRGCIENVEDAALKIKNVISRLETRTKSKIDKLYIGIGGQSIHSLDHNVNHQLNEETPITSQIIESLKEISMNNSFGNKDVLDVLPSEYLIDGKKVIQPIGVYGSEIEVTHKIIVGRSSLKRNISRVFEKLDISLAGIIISPLAASSVMTDAERNLGSVLIDFGAGTTTVSLYKDGLLRYLSVIPIGGNTITKDISSLQILEEEAEKVKTIFGDASPDIMESDTQTIQNKSNPGLEGTKIYTKTLHKVVLARAEEIVENINNQIRLSGYDKQQLGAGVIITGGGARLKNLAVLLKKKLEMDVRIGAFQKTIQSQNYAEIGRDPNYSVLLGLLQRGTLNCKKEEPKVEEKKEEEPVEIVEEETKQETVSEPINKKEEEKEASKPVKQDSGIKKFGKIFIDIFKETSNDEKLSD